MLGWGVGRLLQLPCPLRWLRSSHLRKQAFAGGSLPTVACLPFVGRQMCGNIYAQPGEDKFRRVKLANPAIQQRVAAWAGAVDFLLLAGFQRCSSPEGEDNLEMPADKVGPDAACRSLFVCVARHPPLSPPPPSCTHSLSCIAFLLLVVATGRPCCAGGGGRAAQLGSEQSFLRGLMIGDPVRGC